MSPIFNYSPSSAFYSFLLLLLMFLLILSYFPFHSCFLFNALFLLLLIFFHSRLLTPPHFVYTRLPSFFFSLVSSSCFSSISPSSFSSFSSSFHCSSSPHWWWTRPDREQSHALCLPRPPYWTRDLMVKLCRGDAEDTWFLLTIDDRTVERPGGKKALD